MLYKLIATIIGSAAEGQRKMALGVFVLGLLFLLAVAALVAVWTAPEGTGVARITLLRGVSEQSIAGIILTFGILAGANVLGDHFAGALKAKWTAAGDKGNP